MSLYKSEYPQGHVPDYQMTTSSHIKPKYAEGHLPRTHKGTGFYQSLQQDHLPNCHIVRSHHRGS